MANQRLILDAFIERHRLPAAFAVTATEFFVPLAQWVEQQRVAHGRTGFVLGINGAQGTGKSTLSNFLSEYLAEHHGRKVVELSIDDLYLTRAQRAVLARDVHPLLMTRGVPGTHDVALGCSVIEALQGLKSGVRQSVPRFDKATDDRVAQDDWPQATGPVDIIVLEGWCVGSTAQPDDNLVDPINDLEAREDADGIWRRYVNTKLAEDYPALFDKMNALVYLQAPGFDAIRTWRTEQEHKLRDASSASTQGVLSDEEVLRFIQHFERITRNNFLRLPAKAGAVIQLGPDHAATALQFQ